MTLEFTSAEPGDLPRIVELKIAMFKEAGHEGLLSAAAAEHVLEDYVRLYRESLAIHFIAKNAGYIVASAGAFIKSDLPFCYFHLGIYGFIGDVFTETELRGQGISTRLNKDALGWLKSRNVTIVRLLASDAGRPIYERLGFKPTDEMVLTLET
ncbi:MAG: GNAT family N-acetyltransferase [Gloeobacterales cyanobacterium]